MSERPTSRRLLLGLGSAVLFGAILLVLLYGLLSWLADL